MPSRPRSLQGRLLLSVLACMAAILAVGGVVIHRVIGEHLREEFNALLEDRFSFYAATAKVDGNGVASFVMAEPEFNRIFAPDSPDVVQMWFADSGKFIHKSPASLAKSPSPGVGQTPDTLTLRDVTLPDGKLARVATKVISRFPGANTKRPPVRLLLSVGRDLESVNSTMVRVRSFLVKTGLALTGLALLAVRLLVRRGVRPVKSLSAQIESMPLSDSGQRFALPGAPSELQPVVSRLNALMDRVGAAIDHERQFASNAAHELRNPLAAIRARVEAALSRTRTTEEYEETLDSILESQTGMQRVVDHLLMLARLESGHQFTEFAREGVSLPKLLRKAWRPCFEKAEEKRLRVTWRVEDPAGDIITSVALLEIVARNLFDNAANYTPPGGTVRISASVEGGTGRVCVANTNPGLTSTAVEESFTPFWRSDPNASGHRGNAGIGLALVRRIMSTMGGVAEARLEGAEVVYSISFPAPSAPAIPAPETAVPVQEAAGSV